MHVLGLILLIAGFLGVPVLVLLNVSQNLPLTLAVHAVATMMAVGLCIWKCGSFKAWANYTEKGAVYNVHPGWIVLVGLIFSAAGIYLILHGKPAAGPRGMSPREIVYFGSLFVLLGAGVAAVATLKLVRTGGR